MENESCTNIRFIGIRLFLFFLDIYRFFFVFLEKDIYFLLIAAFLYFFCFFVGYVTTAFFLLTSFLLLFFTFLAITTPRFWVCFLPGIMLTLYTVTRNDFDLIFFHSVDFFLLNQGLMMFFSLWLLISIQ
ncbi:hypothetical protein BVG16_05430 [Paenibacillus selenitireducens]|uniref:Uncharacterized protein n=1 Tax=Paenibacillus selenitireducens TaxID=1324314 RepID=A0A1T2XJY5_9BACL|nr:hypothetical protein BVG16_05430 [Paenibacillus selenitireducens]